MSRNTRSKISTDRSRAGSIVDNDQIESEINDAIGSRRNSHAVGEIEKSNGRSAMDSPRKKKGKGHGARSRSRSPPPTKLPFKESDEFSDVVIKTAGGKELYSNRCLLSYSSPVFMDKLSGGGGGGDAKGDKGGKGKGGGGGDKGRDKDLDLSEKKFEEVCELLCFIDPRVNLTLTDEKAKILLPLAKEYDIQGLLSACEVTIVKGFKKHKKDRNGGRVPLAYLMEYLAISDKYEFEGLKKMCIAEYTVSTDHYAYALKENKEGLSDGLLFELLQLKFNNLHMRYDKTRRGQPEPRSTSPTGSRTSRK